MKESDDPSPTVYISKSKILKFLFVTFLFILGLSILINLESPDNSRASVKTLRSNDYINVAERPTTISFIKEDLNNLEFQRVQQLKVQKQQLWTSVSPTAFEAAIIDQCNAVGCDASQVIRVMYCESSGNPYAQNNIYLGLFQHHVGYWPGRATQYGVPGASIYDPYAQIHVTTRMFAQGLSYLWQCK